jgi:hypothetical protein
MSEAEVEAVLGGPAGDYRTRGDISYDFGLSHGSYIPPPNHVTKEWQTDEGIVIVDFEPGVGAADISRGRGIRPPTWGEVVSSRLRDIVCLRRSRPWLGR